MKEVINEIDRKTLEFEAKQKGAGVRKSTTLFWMQWKRSICGTRRKLQNQGISYTNRR
ncbi:hypothetical protein J2S20_001372 [Moryella indoligenes]|uniref:Uncharacterized protein n=1 Tax=Moryella indoligenes TaxID=371674 RepID=A0AAE4AKA2_9FIRM|nr:hypothetical protein [Moryella indoligenes]MDQ0152678.1 hypothetical protein [Moryella indoligenes]